ncbi:MAG: DNA (cytosine-5-)-methyltransferase [Pseudomonadota bacterium]
MKEAFGVLEFFAGGGMAGLGLGPRWKRLFANEWSGKKAAAYRNNFSPAAELTVRDVRDLTVDDIPGQAHLAWASFPCQDLSLAGAGRGLNGERSGTFHAFWNLIRELGEKGRAVPLVVLENVAGALSSNQGRDFAVLFENLAGAGYLAGPLVIDAVRFLPQSRPRLFIPAVKLPHGPPPELTLPGPDGAWHSRAIITAHDRLPGELKKSWVWWKLPLPGERTVSLADVVEKRPDGVAGWRSPSETEALLKLMDPVNLHKIEEMGRLDRPVVGTVYKRTRPDGQGRGRQRAEVRFDQISGCLRTPGGGSSRQIILEVNGKAVRSRLITAREAARLMGLPDSYLLPEKYNDAYHLVGDGLAVPVVAHLAAHLLEPLAAAADRDRAVRGGC